MIASLIITIALLLAIAARDFYLREIELFYFILLIISVVFFCGCRMEARSILMNCISNSALLGICMICLIGYYRVKKGVPIRSFFSFNLGAGDVLFWFIVTPIYGPAGFMFWMVGSLTVSLVFYLLHMLRAGQPEKNALIPLAGIQAVVLAGCLVASEFFLPSGMPGDQFMLLTFL